MFYCLVEHLSQEMSPVSSQSHLATVWAELLAPRAALFLVDLPCSRILSIAEATIPEFSKLHKEKQI
jgi:hypothetical protein